MEIIRDLLEAIFTYLLYPAVVLGVFLYLIALNISIVHSAKTTSSAIRRAVGAVLPLIILIFVISATAETTKQITSYLSDVPQVTLILAGATLSFVMMESGKRLSNTDATAAISVYAFFISSLIALLFWILIGGLLQALNFALLAFVVTGGIHVIFRGLPTWFGTEDQPKY